LGVGTGGAGTAEQEETASTRIETENDTSFWDDLEDSVTRLVGETEGRHVIANAQAGVLSVRAMPEEHRAVAGFLEIIEGSVQRQVILEARIIEVELLDRFRSGINWELLFEIDGVDFAVGQVAGNSLFDEGTSAIRGAPLDIGAGGTSVGGFQSSAFGGPFTLSAGSEDFSSFIELLETQGNTRVLSSPRIATVNNQKAVIKVGTDEFFVTGVQSQVAAGTAASTAASTVQLTPFFSGIALDVTPQINESGDVILHIHPTVSEVTDQTKTFTTGGREESLPLAFSTVRESDSIIRARSGQLVVIGGLMRDEVAERRIGTPGLGRLPLLGHLFSSRNDESIKTELVILLRPIVIGDDSAWTDMAQERLERIRELGGRPDAD
jgi:MSHA biogenesis protein MshL